MSNSSSPDPLAVPVSQAWGMLGISKNTFYRLVSEGQIQLIKIRSRSVVRIAELERYLAGCEAGPALS